MKIRMWDRIWIVIVAMVMACSCGPGARPAGDADADSDADAEATLPAPPVLTPCPEGWREVPPEEEGGVTTCDPWPGSSPVNLTPCPEGWRAVEGDGVVTCDPWPEDGPQDCAEDEAHFPGEPGCTRIGTACPEGSWAEDLPDEGEILYVLAGAAEGGEGTREAPFGTIAEAIDAARDIDGRVVIALSKGTFDESVRLPNEVTLWGACVAQTIVTCSSYNTSIGTVSVGGRDTVVRNLQLSGRRPGVTVAGGTSYSVRIENVLAVRSHCVALLVLNGRLTGNRIVVRDTLPASDGLYGRGLNVEEGANVELVQAVFERNRDISIYVSGSNTILILSEVVVRDTMSKESDGTDGRGLEVKNGADTDITCAIFERNRRQGILALGSATRLALNDVVVRNTQGQESDGLGGYGLHALKGVTVEVTRATFEGNRGVGVLAFDSGTKMTLNDVVVRDTQGQESDGVNGFGLLALYGVDVEATRATFERNRDTGVVAIGSDTRLVFNDLVVRDTQSQSIDHRFGRGLTAQEGANVEVTRALFDRNREIGVIAIGPDTRLLLNDIVIRDTQGQEIDGIDGRGLGVQDGANVVVNRALFERNRDVGVLAIGPGTSFILSDIVVRQTRERACVSAGCEGFHTGEGILSLGGASVEVNRFIVTENARCGVQLAQGSYEDEDGVFRVYENGGTIDIHDGVISHNPIGINVQTAGFDLDRLTNNVIFLDNGIDLDMTDIPVPEASSPLDGP